MRNFPIVSAEYPGYGGKRRQRRSLVLAPNEPWTKIRRHIGTPAIGLLSANSLLGGSSTAPFRGYVSARIPTPRLCGHLGSKGVPKRQGPYAVGGSANFQGLKAEETDI